LLLIWLHGLAVPGEIAGLQWSKPLWSISNGIAGAALGTVQHKDGEVVWAEPDRARQRLSAGKLLA
jgi:hypothetical protein